jgi:hypothetical protein
MKNWKKKDQHARGCTAWDPLAPCAELPSSMPAGMAPRVGGPRSYPAYEPGLRLTQGGKRDARLAREWKKGTLWSDRSLLAREC